MRESARVGFFLGTTVSGRHREVVSLAGRFGNVFPDESLVDKIFVVIRPLGRRNR